MAEHGLKNRTVSNRWVLPRVPVFEDAIGKDQNWNLSRFVNSSQSGNFIPAIMHVGDNNSGIVRRFPGMDGSFDELAFHGTI